MKKMHRLFLSALITIPSFAQSTEDTANGKFHDDLLSHLVGKWEVTSVAHGFASTAVIEAAWILNHQHLRLHFKGNDVIPWIGTPMEFDYFIGYNHSSKRYVIHAVSVFGNDDDEGFWYAGRTGNEIEIIQRGVNNSDTLTLQRFTWDPTYRSWHIQSRWRVAGKEDEVFLDMKLMAAKTSVKQKNTLGK